MSTPYWGQLPPSRARRSSGGYDQTDRRHSLDQSNSPQQHYDSNRTSMQTANTEARTDSTYTPLASPTTPNVPGGGLAPRPPSFPFTRDKYPSELPDKRRRRASTSRQQDDDPYEFATTSPPPAAPDVPRAPPVSYRPSYGTGGPPYLYNSAGQPGPPRQSHRPEPQARVAAMEPETFYKDATPPAETQARQPVLDRAHRNFDDSVVSAQQLERELVRSGSLRRPTNGNQVDKLAKDSSSPGTRESSGPEFQRKMWAADRSPLQKLELTLDSITKEEKRARVEAAERRARERAAQVSNSAKTADRDKPLSNGPSGQQVRFKDRHQPAAEEESNYAIVADPVQAKPSAATEHEISSQNSPGDDRQYTYSGQSPRSQIPVPKNRSVPTTDKSSMPQRNPSFRERAVTRGLGSPPGPAEDLPQGAQSATPSGGFALARSGSSKLTKNPPGDPWYNARREAEQRSAAYNRLNSYDKSDHTDVRSRNPGTNDAAVRTTNGMAKNVLPPAEDLPRPPARGKAFAEDKHDEERPSRMRELAAAIGFGRSNSMGADQQPSLPHVTDEVPAEGGEYMEYDDLDESPNHRKGLAAAIGFGRANSINLNRPPPANVQTFQGAEPGDRNTKSVKFQDGQHEPGMFDDNGSDAGHHRHHFGQYIHRDKLKPGQGIYKPPTYLDEWKKGTVGMLSGSLLDLSGEPAKPLDKSTTWWEHNGKRRPSLPAGAHKAEAFGGGYDDNRTRTSFKPPLYLKCGPLLRYCGIRYEQPSGRMSRGGSTDKEIWRGSVLIVTQDSESSYDSAPTMRLFVQPIELLPPPPAEIQGEQALLPEYVDPIAGIPKLGRRGETLYVRPVEHLEEARDASMLEPDDGLFELTRSAPDFDTNAPDPPGSFTSRKKRTEVDGEKLGKFKDVRGFRLHTERGHTFWRFNIEVELRAKQQRIAYRINGGPATGFWVPARGESMNIMFHSCNGFSVSVNPDDLSGPDPMWRDVLNTHQTRPFHVMIGGGDQVYNDAVMNKTRLFHEWLEIRNPLHKSNAPFTAAMQDELEAFYLDRYMMWFSQGLFGLANSQIPMVNMYDDHDIIDGFGSYPHHFMKSPVFSGLGNVAFKYYMLFQHQSLPEETEESEPSWCLGTKPGPYINELSRSLFMSLGTRLALLAVDTRTERTRDEVVHEDTWKKIVNRCYDEIVKGQTQHLLVLLGVPIAYPRLVWLENILTSRLMDPIKALGKVGLLGNLLNNFDGGVEVLDDLDDHWTAKNHKDERRFVIEDLQDLAGDKSIRVTILSGDVHLAAVGQFYSNPKLRVPKHKDFRYMPNVISSAIANTPPPDLMADVLNKRNKVHHFDKETDEGMIPIFTHGVDGKPRNNKHLLPHRNWCSIREYAPGHTPPPTPPPDEFEHTPQGTSPGSQGGLFRRFSLSKNRGPALRPDVPRDSPDRSRPPISGGFMRSFSRRGSTSDPSERPESGGLMRTLSLGARPRNLFRRSSKNQPDDGGINGSWAPDDDDDDAFAAPAPRRGPHPSFVGSGTLGLRGGAGNEYEIGDEAHFTANPPRRAFTQPSATAARPGDQNYAPDSESLGDWPLAPTRPFHRTPTGLSAKKLQKNGAERYEVDLEGGLDICLNVEVNAKDPAGITVPYRLLVPRLWYEYQGEDSEPELNPEHDTPADQEHGEPGYGDDETEAMEQPQKKVTGLRRWFSGRGQGSQYRAHRDTGEQPTGMYPRQDPDWMGRPSDNEPR
ncbi:hypothetical protein F5Y19DRAFT_487954 [Xylariaceae sp. FL1651]|nr:hypothetical protein F5Y19DRAFT_487954 [Xylariaceae sp. FL1651]